MVAIFLSSSGPPLWAERKPEVMCFTASASRKGEVLFCVCFRAHVYSALSSLYPALLHTQRQIFLMGPPTTSSTHALYHGFRGLGLTLAPQLSDMGGVVGAGHGSLIP